MSWWGKILAGTLGYMLGGFLGALLGIYLGHKLDKRAARINMTPEEVERVQTAFFTTTFLAMGHLAKADGRVSEKEIAQAKFIMQQMQLTPEQTKTAMDLFNEGKSDGFDLETVMTQFRKDCGQHRNLKQMFLEILISTAMADGGLDPQEKEVLLEMCKYLRFSSFAFDKLIQMMQAQRKYSAGGRQQAYENIEDAYNMLGIKSDASDSEVKKSYRKLMSQHHPDKLVSRGLPEEMLKLATEKTQEIKAAYEQIKKERNMR